MGQKNSSRSNKSKGDSDKKINSNKNANKNKSINIVLQRNTFDFLYVIGKGGFGKVIFFGNILI
jgi:hypothetical protein